jgi:ferric-dicitrate binding protein FerR (iron transport regulator)
MKQKKIKKLLCIAKAIRDDIEEIATYDSEAAFAEVERRIAVSERRALFLRFFYRAAAILFLPLSASTLFFSRSYLQHVPEHEVAYYTVTSSPGSILQLSLPDNSKVWLNAGSSLRYPARFADSERTVFLNGEGYFDVSANKQSPFSVSLNNESVKVKAFGTKFNVSAYEDEATIEAVLESGKVEVFSGKKTSLLKPGELASISKPEEHIKTTKINTYLKTSWKDGRLIFRNATMEEVVKSLSRRYNVDIVLHKQSPKTYRFRASFADETISQILSYLRIAAPIEWKISPSEQKDDTSFERQRIDLWIK